MTWREWTVFLLVTSPILAGIYDLAAYRLGGNSATISRVLLDSHLEYPIVGFSIVFALGVMVGHFFFPQHLDAK